MKIAIFSDFDGTISTRDIGYSIFNHFSGGRNNDLLPDWKSGKMTTRDCLLAEAAMVNAPKEEIEQYLQQFEIDPAFHTLVQQCDAKLIPLKVISDGLDFYIKYVLTKHNLGHLDYLANHAVLANNTIEIDFPYENRSCSSCGICKGEQIRNYRAQFNGECRVIFIGDGYSDACAAGEADILFAKKDLVEYCEKKNIPYNSFDDFTDVIKALENLGLL